MRWIDVVAHSAGVDAETVATVVDALAHHDFHVVTDAAMRYAEDYFNGTPMDEQRGLHTEVVLDDRQAE